ncbi:MAG: DivIVA domain-containing protein [Ruminococcus sp.]|nr:DivIVA domain-containing protein [Ruminococcus sp.]
MLNPNSIKNQNFNVIKNGYDLDEVNDYLRELADEYAVLVKENQEKDKKIAKLSEKVNELNADKDAITDVLVTAQKDARKIVNDAKLQAKDMIDSAKTEQMRLAEQSAAECERIVKEHKEKCAKLIRDNTAITENKINTVKTAYEDELARYKQLQADVTYFKSNLIELYKEQIQLVMDLPTMTEEELDEYEASFDENGNYVPHENYAAPAEEASTQDAPAIEDNAQSAEEQRVDQILNTGSFEPVIPKSTLNDLQFGKNN